MSDVNVDAAWTVLEPFYKAVGFDPLSKQKLLLCSEQRFNIFVGGVGAGKSYTTAYFAALSVLSKPLPGAEREPRYWLVGESLDIPKPEMQFLMDILTEYGMELKDVSTPTEGRWKFRVPGVCLVETRSWTNWDSLHGRAIQGMLICEAGLLPFRVWHERLRARLSRVRGSWCLMSGTLEDAEPFFKELVRDVVVENNKPGWFGVAMATWDNTHIFPKGLEDPEIQELKETTPPDIFMERYGAIPKTLAALVYREFAFKHHVGIYRFDKHQPVYLWIDPAGGYALNAVQRHGMHTYIIDEIHIEPGNTERVIEEAVKRQWWNKVEYGVIDATQTEARAIWEHGYIWEALEKDPIPLRYKKVPVEPGIELVRTQLHTGIYDHGETPVEATWLHDGRRGISLLHLDARCTETIREFTLGYRRKKLASGLYSDRDIVKRDDHHMDCIRYGLAEMLGFSASARASARAVEREYVDSRPNTVGDLHAT